MASQHLVLARRIADLFAALSQVEAVALAGSRGSGPGTSDADSDIDLYVYTHSEVPLEARQSIVERTGGATRADLKLEYWGPGDEWFNATSGIEVDIVYFDADWMEQQILRLLEGHQVSQGYTTCFWYTVNQSLRLFDRHGWFAQLQRRCQVDYPEALRQNIVAFNYPVLRDIIPAYAQQLKKAVKRRDLVSVNHRLGALLACYFDILLAVNRQLHPGEKRLIEFVLNNCSALPAQMTTDLEAILFLTPETLSGLPERLTDLLNRLDELLERQGFALQTIIGRGVE